MGRKGLKTVSIVILVIGVFCLLVCIAVGWGGEQLLEEKNLAMSLSDFIGSLALSLLGAGLALATGILGLRLAVQGKGACACKVMGVLLLVFQAASSVINLLGGDRSS